MAPAALPPPPPAELPAVALIPEPAWEQAGFRPWTSTGPFLPTFIRYYVRETSGVLTFRARVAPHHCNGGGMAHGGFLSALADVWLGATVSRHYPQARFIVTVTLTVEYLRPVHPGAVLESQIDRLHPGRGLCRIAGQIFADGHPAAAMSATFSVGPPRPAEERGAAERSA